MTTITRRYHFCASHRLHSIHLSDAENERTYGKCNNPYGHGHDYSLDVSVTGQLDPESGLIINLADLDNFVSAEILAGFAYRNLNADVPEFSSLVPTTENLALVVAAKLGKRWLHYFPYSSAHLSGIFIQETARNSFEVPLYAPRLRYQPNESGESEKGAAVRDQKEKNSRELLDGETNIERLARVL